jgi:hypothetical protein
MKDLTDEQITEMRAVDRAGGHEHRAKQLCESFKLERLVGSSGRLSIYSWSAEIAGERYQCATDVPFPDESDEVARNNEAREMLARHAVATIARVLSGSPSRCRRRR